MSSVLQIENLSKNFGSIRAVNGVSLSIEHGTTYGILGPNGSGKTTLLAMVLGVRKANNGTYQWFDKNNFSLDRKKIGAILETPNFYPYLSGYRNLKIAADIKGVPYQEIDRVLHLVNLYERRKSKFSAYSLGMKQRLALAAALLGDPEVLVLDEPTNGLDPQGIAEVRSLINKIAGAGKTIILASHLLDEVEKVCTHVAIMKSGRLLSNGSVKDVLGNNEVVEISNEDLEKLKQTLVRNPEIKTIAQEGNKLVLTLSENMDIAGLNKYLVEQGIMLTHLAVKKKSLEAEFLEITKERF